LRLTDVRIECFAAAGSADAVCYSPYTSCYGKCVNLKTDKNNCGYCGHVCKLSSAYKYGEVYCRYVGNFRYDSRIMHDHVLISSGDMYVTGALILILIETCMLAVRIRMHLAYADVVMNWIIVKYVN